MKTTVITGLDGSGKSTLLQRLSVHLAENQAIIFVPHIPLEGLETHPELLEAATFIHTLSHQADRTQTPALKAVALLASMLVFRELVELKQAEDKSEFFCERHPLIDTVVYARFYLSKFEEATFDPVSVEQLDARFPEALEFLLGLLPAGYVEREPESPFTALMGFIRQWFFVEKRMSLTDLQALFGVRLPDEIYFLKADPEVLDARLGERAVREAHEQLAVFRKLDLVYEEILGEIEAKSQTQITVVNANDPANLDQLFRQLAGISA